jgi:hypothetical protein
MICQPFKNNENKKRKANACLPTYILARISATEIRLLNRKEIELKENLNYQSLWQGGQMSFA